MKKGDKIRIKTREELPSTVVTSCDGQYLYENQHAVGVVINQAMLYYLGKTATVTEVFHYSNGRLRAVNVREFKYLWAPWMITDKKETSDNWWY